MGKIVFFLKLLFVLTFYPSLSISQDLLGQWEGVTNQSKIIVKWDVMVQDTMLKVMMFSPVWCQMVDSFFQSPAIRLGPVQRNVSFHGELTVNKNHIHGEIYIDGVRDEVNMFRGAGPILRPQEPRPPFPYVSENVVFENKEDGVKLAGTLTLPDSTGVFPAVILLSGSRPNTRDYDANQHKLFLVLADYLTRHGIAVLRYDDRGIGRSKGNYYDATIENFALDAVAGVDYLSLRKDINNHYIGLIGHSQGGMVASIAASNNEDIAFIVLMGSPGIPLKDIFQHQFIKRSERGDLTDDEFRFIKRFQNMYYQAIEHGSEIRDLKDSLDFYWKEYSHIFPDSSLMGKIVLNETMKMLLSNYSRSILQVNPSVYLEKVKCPVLSLHGSNDNQVSAEINAEAIRNSLNKAGNTRSDILILDGLNHGFQECVTGSIKESLEIEQTIAPAALETILDWVLKHTRAH